MKCVLITNYFHPASQNSLASNVTKIQKLSEDVLSVTHSGVASVKKEAQKNCKPLLFFSGLKKLLKLSVQSSASVCIPHD